MSDHGTHRPRGSGKVPSNVPPLPSGVTPPKSDQPNKTERTMFSVEVHLMSPLDGELAWVEVNTWSTHLLAEQAAKRLNRHPTRIVRVTTTREVLP